MNKIVYFILLLFYSLTSFGQNHFTKFKAIKYKESESVSSTDTDDLVRITINNFNNKKEFKNTKIELKEINDTDSSTIYIYKADKLIQ